MGLTAKMTKRASSTPMRRAASDMAERFPEVLWPKLRGVSIRAACMSRFAMDTLNS